MKQRFIPAGWGTHAANRSRAVTIREVAERAGVSATTVLRSLRGMSTVAPATRYRVGPVRPISAIGCPEPSDLGG